MSEQSLQAAVCTYLKLQYPKVVFNSDLSGLKLTLGQAVKLKGLRSSRAFPDLMIFEPRGCYHGLFLELKAQGVSIFKKRSNSKGGFDYVSPHVEEQATMIEMLTDRGYAASFAVGFQDAKELIDAYLNYGKLQRQ